MTDTKDELLCPACGKKLKKIYLENNKMNIDICTNGCGGIFFDNRELEKVDEAHENADEILKEIENKSFEEVDSTLPRLCPACGTTMMKMGGANGRLEIDVCAVCGGKFLDAGEFQIIRNVPSESISEATGALLEQIYEQDVENINNHFKWVNKLPVIMGYEKRKEFFTKIASKYIEKGK